MNYNEGNLREANYRRLLHGRAPLTEKDIKLALKEEQKQQKRKRG